MSGFHAQLEQVQKDIESGKTIDYTDSLTIDFLTSICVDIANGKFLKPSARLRWVKTDIEFGVSPGVPVIYNSRGEDNYVKLQQAWIDDTGNIEWRDIDLIVE